MSCCDIFLSYRRKDIAGFQLCSVLYEQLLREYDEGQIFRDQDSMDYGEYPSQIESKIRNAKVVFILIGDLDRWLDPGPNGPRIFQPDCWVRKEAEIALSMQALVIPIISGNVMPSKDQLPPGLENLLGLHFEHLPPSETNWASEGIKRVVTKMRRQMPLDFSVHAVLRRLIKPLQIHHLEVRRTFASAQEKARLWTYYQAAIGVEAVVERRPELNFREFTLTSALEDLAMTPSSEALLRFLLLVLLREEGGEPAFPKFPDTVRKAWMKVIDEVSQGGIHQPWELEGNSVDDLLAWAEKGEIRPRFSLFFEQAPADDQATFRFRMTGWMAFGYAEEKLDLREEWFPSEEVFNGRMDSDGRRRFSNFLRPVLEQIVEQVETWLGREIRVEPLPLSLTPVLEIYVKAEQLGWPLEQVFLDDDLPVGAVFRTIRKLEKRHIEKPRGWKVRSQQFSTGKPNAAKDIAELATWDELDYKAQQHGSLFGFVIADATEKSCYELIFEHHLICGVWVQAEDSKLSSKPLRDLFCNLGDEFAPGEAVRLKRQDSISWRAVTVLDDPDPAIHGKPYRKPPGVQDVDRKNKRCSPYT